MIPHLKTYLCLTTALIGLLLGCQPPALPIDVQQEAPKLALASSVIDANTVFVAVTYSTNSLNTVAGNQLSVPSALVVLSSAESRDTLRQLYPGLYGATSLNLEPNSVYTLTVSDNVAGSSVTGSCSYVPLGTVNAVKPTVSRTASETTVSLRVDVQDDLSQTDYYVMNYSKVNPAAVPTAIGVSNFQAFGVSSIKKLELFSDADAVQGRIVRDFPLNIDPTDTLYTSVSRIEKGFYEYLTAYKRSGSGFIDLGSEPVTLPTNVVPGLGYFYLNETKRSSFILTSY